MRTGRWLVTCLLALVFTVPVHAGEIIWTKEFKKDVKYKKLTAGGVYLVMTDDGLYGLDPKTGNEIWSLQEDGLKEDDIEYVEGSPLLLVAKGKGFVKKTIEMSVVNVMDGKENWHVEGIEGILVGSQLIFDHGIVLLFTMGGKDGIAIHAYDMFDGSHKYQVAFPAKQEMKKVNLIKPPGAGTFSSKLKIMGHQEPVVDGDHLIMFYDYLRKIDLKTGQQVWMDQNKKRPKESAVPMITDSYAQMVSRDGVLYTPYGKGIAAFDAATGNIKWEFPKVGGEITAVMMFNGDRLYYRGGGVIKGEGKKAKYINPVFGAVSLANGSAAWAKEFKMKGGCTNLVFMEDRAYVSDTSNLLILSTTDGTHLNKSDKFKLGFKGGAPNTLTNRNDGLLVQGANDVALINIKGDSPSEAWHQYYKAPGASMFAKLAMAAVSTMAAMEASSRAMNSYAGTTENRWANENRAQAWDGFNKVMGIRYTATQSSDKYQYVLTDLDDGAGLKGINLVTGQGDREVLFKEKQPDYDVDEIGGVVFFLKGDKKLQVYNLN